MKSLCTHTCYCHWNLWDLSLVPNKSETLIRINCFSWDWSAIFCTLHEVRCTFEGVWDFAIDQCFVMPNTYLVSVCPYSPSLPYAELYTPRDSKYLLQTMEMEVVGICVPPPKLYSYLYLYLYHMSLVRIHNCVREEPAVSCRWTGWVWEK